MDRKWDCQHTTTTISAIVLLVWLFGDLGKIFQQLEDHRQYSMSEAQYGCPVDHLSPHDRHVDASRQQGTSIATTSINFLNSHLAAHILSSNFALWTLTQIPLESDFNYN